MNPQQPPIIQPGSPSPPPPPNPGPQAVPPGAKAGADKTNPNSTQNSLQISEIRDGIVIMNDGTFRSVLMCQSINFDLMSPDEREAIEYSYQGFLNSLYFPIQVFVRSQKIDLAPYLDRLSKRRNSQESMLLGVLMDDYIAFLDDIADRTNIMDKKFYVVIGYPDSDADIRRAIKTSAGFFNGLFALFRPTKPPQVVIDENLLEKGKTELRNRINSVVQGLQTCGVNSVPLDTQELIELYYEAYNPETSTNQHLADAKDLAVPIITKGKGQKPTANISEGPTS
jgi:hypothetical protein